MSARMMKHSRSGSNGPKKDKSLMRRGIEKLVLVACFFSLVLGCSSTNLFSTASWIPEAHAQSEQSEGEDSAQEHVKVSLESDSSSIKPGGKIRVAAVFEIEPHWHIYYKDPGEAGMPTQVDWQLPEGFEAGPLLWEKPDKFEDAGIITYGYSNRTVIASEIKVPADFSQTEKVKIKADAKWLSCKDICLPGEGSASLELPVSNENPSKINNKTFSKVGFTGTTSDIGVDNQKPEELESKSTESGEEKTGGQASSESSQNTGTSVLDQKLNIRGEDKKEMNPLLYMGFALIGGFILNFMPCVLPVISIKVLSFMEQADEEPKRVRLLGLTFTGGIISAFIALAIIVLTVRSAGQAVGWGFQFQYPGFVILMCVIVLLLALSLFGLFYVSVPGSQSELDKLASREGYVGTFFKGVLATTLSTPCTAPFLGTALGFAFAEPAPVVLGIFFMSGLGMALPYLLLTINPGWMKFIPRPGVWMEKFKESMGFLLLATVIWLLSVLGGQIGVEGVMWVSFFLLGICISSWIISRFTDLTSTKQTQIKVWSVAAAITAASFYLFIIKQDSVLLALDPNQTVSEQKVEKFEKLNEHGIVWQPFSVAQLDKELSSGKTVFLDFTADWCFTCKINEKTVIDTKPVSEKMKELGVVTMKADWTRRDPVITEMIKKFNRAGVPLYVIFPADNPNSPIVLPEVVTQDLVIKALESAGKSKTEETK